MVWQYRFVALVTLLVGAANPAWAEIVDFEELSTAGGPYNGASAYTGPGSNTDFTSGGATFHNAYEPTYGSWGGWAYANVALPVDPVALSQPDYTYQYNAAAPSGGIDPATPLSTKPSTYAVAYQDPFTPTTPTITLPAGEHPVSVQVTNSTYTALSMVKDDGYSHLFSGPNADNNFQGSWFLMTITGYANNQSVGTVDFYLADYRSADPAQHYIVQNWTNVNLGSLHDATSLTFTFTSSDHAPGDPSPYGILTPTYAAIDDLSLTNVIGNANGDSIVNGQDIAIASSNWLHASPVGDVNGDGIVNGQDIALMSSNWLATPPLALANVQGGAAPANVPEPATGLLAVLGLALLGVGVKLRR
jgi:hypothetical protein